MKRLISILLIFILWQTSAQVASFQTVHNARGIQNAWFEITDVESIDRKPFAIDLIRVRGQDASPEDFIHFRVVQTEILSVNGIPPDFELTIEGSRVILTPINAMKQFDFTVVVIGYRL